MNELTSRTTLKWKSQTISQRIICFPLLETPIHQRPIVGIILGVLGGIILIFLILVICLVVLISYSQRQQQLRDKKPYLFDSMPTLPFSGIASDFYSQDDTLSDTSDSVISEETIRSLSSSQSRGTSWELARRISDIDEDTRMRYLMDVIRNSPYINVSCLVLKFYQNILTFCTCVSIKAAKILSGKIFIWGIHSSLVDRPAEISSKTKWNRSYWECCCIRLRNIHGHH